MNKSKLLITSALAGVVGFAGIASADVGGTVSHTYTFSSDNETSSTDATGDRIGTEFNLTFGGKKDLDNGMFAGFSGKWEYDGNGSSHPDLEYESQFGMENFYIGIGNDGGNKVAGFAGNYVSYAPSSLTKNVTNETISAAADGYISDIEGKDNISANMKAAGGTFTIRYTPNTAADHGNDIDSMSSGSSGTAILYNGSPVEGLKVRLGRNDIDDGSSGTADKTETSIGASYNFGQFTLGVDRKDYEASSVASTSDKEMTMLTGTYAISDSVTAGISYHETEAGGDNSSSPDEEGTTLSIGYNLGGAVFSANLVQVENVGNTTGVDAEGLVLTSAFKF
jgi:hypothetical protein